MSWCSLLVLREYQEAQVSPELTFKLCTGQMLKKPVSHCLPLLFILFFLILFFLFSNLLEVTGMTGSWQSSVQRELQISYFVKGGVVHIIFSVSEIQFQKLWTVNFLDEKYCGKQIGKITDAGI